MEESIFQRFLGHTNAKGKTLLILYTTVARIIHINSNAYIKLKLIVMSAIGVDNALSCSSTPTRPRHIAI